MRFSGRKPPCRLALALAAATASGPGSASGSVVVDALAPDSCFLLLRVASNCRVDGENPRSVRVNVAETTPVTLAVTCVVASGTVRVTTTTTGVDLDRYGYTIRVEGFSADRVFSTKTQRINANDTRTLSQVPTGGSLLTLNGIAVNCDPIDLTNRSVWVNAGDTVAVTFRFACTPDTDSAAYVDVTSGVRHIVIASVNGGRLRRLMNSPGIDEDPAWSPDGKRIAFTTTRDANAEIYVMNADGTSQQRLTTNKSRDRDPAWSPDGRISFASDRDGSTFGTTDVYVMNADGSQVTRLTTNTGADPAWSGDGRLAYTSVDCRYYYCQPSIVVRTLSRADSLVDVGPGKRPSWSPDGRKLAYEGFVDCAFYYYECLPGGLRVVRLNPEDVSSLGAGTRPAWPP